MNERGQLHVPLALALALLAVAALGMLGLLHHWRGLAALQLRLDRCVGKTALALRAGLEDIEAANREIGVIRKALVATVLLPSAEAALQLALKAEVLRQEARQAAWNARRAAWWIRRGCDGASDVPVPLPTMAWERDPPDALGPQPLRWRSGAVRALHLQLGHSPRHAAATVDFKEREDVEHEKHEWRADWASPRSPARLLGSGAD